MHNKYLFQTLRQHSFNHFFFVKRNFAAREDGGGLSWKNDLFKSGIFYRELPEGVKPTHIIVGAGSAGCVLVKNYFL